MNRTRTVDYWAERTRKAEFVFQLEYGPARALLSFSEVEDVFHNMSDESTRRVE